jgi:hypothetical protein
VVTAESPVHAGSASEPDMKNIKARRDILDMRSPVERRCRERWMTDNLCQPTIRDSVRKPWKNQVFHGSPTVR